MAFCYLQFPIFAAIFLQKSLSSFKSIISSSWIEPQELKYFISALGNLGASLYNTGQLKQVTAI